MLEETVLRKLEQLTLVARRVRAGQTAGERRSTKRGSSVEFADYRDYVKGDDLRRVDWNIYARLERPYVKLFEEEEDLAVHILLDGSGSMDWGGMGRAGDQETGSGGAEENKWRYARRLAAALGYVALTSGDRLTVVNLQPSVLDPHPLFGPVRGRGYALRLFDWLAAQQAGGATDLDGSLRTYAFASGRPGLTVLISDMFSPLRGETGKATPRGAGYVAGLTTLAARGHEVLVVHTLSPDEVAPPLGGDLRLLDVETGEAQEVTIDGGMRARYRERLDDWREEIRATCRARDVHYVPVETSTPFDRVVLYDLRRAGVVR
ncbi:MAG TPA: DUF58 domain-containing protein [Chloroflexi bacterium]|nr:DUF58 domain-containing protein [Chloroflexota bacterium]